MSRILLVSAAALLVVAGTAQSQPAVAPYCENLKQIILLAASREKFASIAARRREGNFSDTSLALTGWSDCSVYGSRTYTCDFQPMKSAEEAEAEQSKIVQEIKT